LKFEDSMFNEDYYCTAAGGIIKLYLHLHDNPSLTEEEKEPDYSKMTAAEKKKAKAIARKKRNQAEKKAAQEKKKEEDDEKDGKKKKKHVLDEDPEGAELLKKNPLEEASKFSSILAKYSPKRIETWAHQFDVSIRRKKNLLALQALFKLKNLDPDAPEYLTRLVYFGTTMGSFTDESAVVKDVIKTEMDKLLNGKSLEAYVSDTAASAKNGSTSLPRRIGIALSLFRSNPKATEEAASIILDGGVDTEGVSVETCKSASDALTKINAQSAKKEWTSIVKAKFPLLKDFA
jgi:N-alpha-acetyltransferase 15/16, NatA auxiliary subunit